MWTIESQAMLYQSTAQTLFFLIEPRDLVAGDRMPKWPPYDIVIEGNTRGTHNDDGLSAGHTKQVVVLSNAFHSIQMCL